MNSALLRVAEERIARAVAAAALRDRSAVRDALGRLAALRNAHESAGSLNRPAWARYAPQLLQRLARRR